MTPLHRTLAALAACLAIPVGIALAPGVDRPEAAAEAPPPAPALTFAVVPQQSATRLARGWGPLVAALGRQTGLPLRFVTTKDIPTFEACLDAGAFDVAYMNPYHYAVFSERAGYRAVAHRADRRLTGLVVVRAGSGLSDIADLAGETVAFPSPGAFGASVLPRAEMARQGIEVEPRYVRSHDSVYRAVADGFAAAGGGVARTLAAAPEPVRAALRVIHTTDAYTPHAIAVRGDADPAATAALRAALAALHETAPETLVPLGITAFAAADDAAWDDVRALRLQPEQTGLDRLDEVSCPFE